MNNNKLLLLIIGIGITFSACVSKKKYVAMESSKMRAEQRVRELNDENDAKAKRLEQMIADYEQTKTELLSSNAEKDQMINNLNGEINKLSSNVAERDASMEEKIYAFEYEKRRLAQQAEDYKTEMGNLNEGKKSLSAEIKQLNGDLSGVRFNLNRKTEENEKLQLLLNKKNRDMEELSGQLASVKAEVQKLKVDLQAKDETIERLNNNVSLLKKELGGN